jgi:hypothetical protein
MQMKIAVTAAGFILIFLTGYWLSRTGQHKSSAYPGGADLSVPAGEQPFNAVVLAIHKLITIATIVYLVLTVLRISRIAPLSPVEWIVFVGVIVLFLLTIASGGWLSAVKTMPAAIRTLHHILPFLTAISTAAFLYLLLRIE